MSYIEDLRKGGFSYLGAVAKSAKMEKSYKANVSTYCIYLAPADMAGRDKYGHKINVCPFSAHCKDLCLNGSGRNIGNTIFNGGYEYSTINRVRIKKTKLFFNDRETFMRLMIHEIKREKARAEKNGMQFAIRINGTSDLSPERFVYQDKNILEIFPDVQFYDYTKVPIRLKLATKYPNYDLTFSYDGYNWNICEEYLKKGGKVAVVFDSPIMPETYNGFKVIDANKYDMRYLDEPGCIMGLEFHKTVSKDGKIQRHGDNKFVVSVEENNDIVYRKTA